jgi:hypothetical protein
MAWSNGKSAIFGLKTADLNGGFRPVVVSTRSGAGTRLSALKSRPRMRPDPPESPALLKSKTPVETTFFEHRASSSKLANDKKFINVSLPLHQAVVF